jgi:hypothetical protein
MPDPRLLRRADRHGGAISDASGHDSYHTVRTSTFRLALCR